MRAGRKVLDNRVMLGCRQRVFGKRGKHLSIGML